MVSFAKEIIPVSLEEEMRQSYLDYAMSVIVGRALPDVRDGLKPVHRRVLYSMRELGNDWNRPHKKSARVVGDVIGKYHPHGDTAVYDAIVRLAQPFSMRYMLIDGQGNFGSVDGDPPAAMRYTEVRMSRIAHDLLADLDKDTVNFLPNFDETEREPSVLPTRVPNLLINGSAGIAVGMATNIPPHNLTEVIGACLQLIEQPEATIHDLLRHVPGPDFPTAGLINGSQGIHEAYLTGRGRISVRARCHFETDDSGRISIVATELPYQVNKARLLEKIAELVKDARLEGISALRDESDKDGLRMVIELKRGEFPEVVLNNLYQHTQMESVFGINMVALDGGRPRCMNLKEILVAFIDHRREVVTRRTVFDLRKARQRTHILEGLLVALANIDPVIELIKSSRTSAEAKQRLVAETWQPGAVTGLLERVDPAQIRPEDLPLGCGLVDGSYRLSEAQAEAILELRLSRLTGLEQEKIVSEYRTVLEEIAQLLAILGSDVRLMEVIRGELEAAREQFGDARRTEIVVNQEDLTAEDLITPEEMVVTVSHHGYVKAQPLAAYRAQRRGGRGKAATATKEEDFVERILIANTHDTLLCFSSAGKVYWLKVYQLPQASRNAQGKPFVNVLPLEENERVQALVPIQEFNSDRYIFLTTAQGVVKKTSLVEFERPRPSGKIAIELSTEDGLVAAAVTSGRDDVLLISDEGKAVCFAEDEVRPMGRTAAGVRGIRLRTGQQVVALLIAAPHDDSGDVLCITENGYGKRTPLREFPRHGRGGQGVIAMQTGERNGALIGAVLVSESDEIMVITDGGTVVRTRVGEMPQLSRNTQGVRTIRVADGEKVVGLDRIAAGLDDTPADGAADTDA